MTALPAGRTAAGCAAIAFFLTAARPLAAQTAWTPVKGESNLSIAFQRIDYSGHFWDDGSKHEGDVPSRAYVGVLQYEYGLTDKLTFNAQLPYIASRFTVTDDPGTVEFRAFFDEVQRNTPGGEAFRSLDTGAYYATFQDVGVTFRYNALDGALVVTPLIGATIPSHDYRTAGEAAPGQKRLALHTGVNVGRLLDPFLPQMYVHGRYTYSFVQSLYDVPLNRSNAEFEAGYAVSPLVSVRALAAWSRTHGGLTYDETLLDTTLFLDHDRLVTSGYWHLGGGATVAVTDTFDLDAAFVRFLAGTNTHYGLGLTIGATWRFAPPLPSARPAARLARRH